MLSSYIVIQSMQMRNIEDEVEAIRDQQRIFRKADEIRRHNSIDAAKIAEIYEKFSLENIDIGLENRRKIRAGIPLYKPAKTRKKRKKFLGLF